MGKKKFIIIGIMLVTIIGGSIGGVAMAQAGTATDSPAKTLMARVAEKLGINQTDLENAFTEARSELQAEALDARLQKQVDEGTITQEQADQYKAWLQARPDAGAYQQQLRDWQQTRPPVPPEFKDWQEARPDVPMPGPFGRHSFGGKMRGGHFGGK
ncbi:MAG: hypothetical protein ABID87_04550 [Chloroflexota bacterium]